MKRSFFAVLTASTLFASQLMATQLDPWHGMTYDIDLRGTCLLQQFERLDTGCGTVKRPEFDAFYELSALMVAQEALTVEMELSASDTRHRLFGLNAFRLTGRYFFLNDVVGDPVSVAAGLTVSKIFHAARRNIATFDHGGIACEGHVAVGKELSCEQFWTSRAWAVLGFGVADVGSPWLRANLAWEKNWWERHQLKVFTETLWGFAGNDLNLSHPFHGYGSINYQAVEVGLRYGFRFNNDALLSVGYAYRVYGRNCPKDVNLLKLEICSPFSL